MKFLFSMWISLYCWLASAQELADRLLIEIDLHSYTQTQMELYLICKDALGGGDQIRSVETGSWDRLLEEFKNDMVMHQEATRLGSFEATARVLEKALDVFQDRKTGSEEIGRQLERLGADESVVRKIVAMAVRVEGFRRSKERQAAVQEGQPDGPQVQQKAVQEWQKELIARSVVRYYDGAVTFKAVRVGI
jgi:hypothetical protein